ncbi:cytoplasmic dynein 1 intermediate chain 2 isoform X30 [Octopus bimaculoides]|uniref:cytoplasmic dynein 1 intermediate chain 2 isoform X30 n=1 Tax=Octopus bimaculoides TaxID=37653 RepID=UPI00071D0DD1|nr:cytoplasmic dynein 1 intermediate chain 2 isoform X30 [Octopus bimaculoides]|eukprot:XP_014771176.1 PREDICTED: cytoplasmic dynein 1 intermediate chain 2-like isoform X19 [Octopus bimaculoides]
MSDRKAELERKKARLEQMRKERQEKEQRRKLKDNEEVKPGKPPQDLRAETDALLQDLGIPPNVWNRLENSGRSGSISPTVQDTEQTNVVISGGSTRPKVKLSICKVSETTIAPKENVSYSKETQTTSVETGDREDFPQVDARLENDDNDDTDSVEASSETTPAHQHKMPHVEMVQPAKTQQEIEQESKVEKWIKELSDDEKKQIMSSEDFQNFFNRSSRLVERVLAENETDMYIDYVGSDKEGKDDDQFAGDRLKLNRYFFDERWSKHRTITSLDWSTQHPELLVASYNTNEESPHDPDGVVLVWNSKFKKDTPEFIFHCQSAVMSSCFANFHPNLVVGGTYSGQIVLWDNRVNKRTPVQRTPLTAAAHTHPVYCIKVVGTQNAHNLISVSTDGKICCWSLDMLSQPQDSMELQHRQSKAVAVTCFSFLAGDVNNFVVGSEDCTVYTASRHGSKAGITESFEGHQGPVTGIDCHNVPGQIDFSPYFLTSSFDWTIKLWSNRDSKYIHSFEDNSDYVYDVQWSPIHPAMFASVDGMGRLDLWHLNNETEVPTATAVSDNNVALNRCRWHQSGHHIAAGDDNGRINVYDVGEHIANPKNDEWSCFRQTLQELKSHAAEREEDSSFMGSMTVPLR